jgi:hypothetical protein
VPVVLADALGVAVALCLLTLGDGAIAGLAVEVTVGATVAANAVRLSREEWLFT